MEITSVIDRSQPDACANIERERRCAQSWVLMWPVPKATEVCKEDLTCTKGPIDRYGIWPVPKAIGHQAADMTCTKGQIDCPEARSVPRREMSRRGRPPRRGSTFCDECMTRVSPREERDPLESND